MPLGLGSDIGGSVRIPAHFCGVSALKPTAHRMPPLGSINPVYRPRRERRRLGGPVGAAGGGLALAYSIVAGGLEAEDPSIPPVALGGEVTLRGLRVGWYSDDGYAAAAPALRRAVSEAATALGKLGVELVEWRPPDIDEAMRIYAGLMGADGLASLRRLLRGGKVDPNVRVLTAIAPRGPMVRQIVASIAGAAGQPRIAAGTRSFGRVETAAYWQLVADRRAYHTRFFAALSGLDALLCPPMPCAAFTHGANVRIGLSNHYCALFNLLGLPAGVVQATRVRPGEESDRAPGRELGTRALAKGEARARPGCRSAFKWRRAPGAKMWCWR